MMDVYKTGRKCCQWLWTPQHYNLTDTYVQVRIARIFNTYGPRMCIDDGRVVSNFVSQVCSALDPFSSV
jgi:UDP-glucuronate decarboxylase